MYLVLHRLCNEYIPNTYIGPKNLNHISSFFLQSNKHETEQKVYVFIIKTKNFIHYSDRSNVIKQEDEHLDVTTKSNVTKNILIFVFL